MYVLYEKPYVFIGMKKLLTVKGMQRREA